MTQMVQITQISEIRSQILAWKQQGLSVGFVPTMGNLHAGHLSLVDIAKRHCHKVVVSIFVNPLQFGPGEDFDAYPRTEKQDIEKLLVAGVDICFLPRVDEMYPFGSLQTKVSVFGSLSSTLEGAARPTHFDGVTTVVSKLFNIVQPDVAVFGQKDLQQWRIIEQMVTDLSMPITLIKAPIERDVDGLALSSRNQYLTVAQRAIAPKLWVVLQDVAAGLLSGNLCVRNLEITATEQLLLHGFDKVDYLKIVELDSLEEFETKAEHGYKQLVAELAIVAVARLGKTRLLDNLIVKIDLNNE